MQPYIPQAMVAGRIADMHREADSARLAREMKRTRRLAGRHLATVRPLRAATPAAPAARAEVPARRTEHAGRPAA
jgi:hypothetical protein